MIRFGMILAATVMSMTAAYAQAKGEHRGALPGKFDFYVLSLSWSPTYCAGPGGARSPVQCAPKAGRDFVVHGLWPQYDEGFPTDCGGDVAELPKSSLEAAHALYPDDKLAATEWRRHGTCTARGPADYLADVKAARAKIVIPAQFKHPVDPQTLSPADIERAFITANSDLSGEMMAVTCRSNTFQEVRICLKKDLSAFQACPEINLASCRARNISVPSVN